MLRRQFIKYIFLIPICMSCIVSHVYGQKKHDQAGNEKFVKKGWSITPLPVVSYDSDRGLQLGAMVDIYDFGDGSEYPEYFHRIMAEACYYTKGSGIYHVFYDSKYLLRNLRLTASATYIPNTMMPFFGFNGYVSPYYTNMNRSFYAVKRNQFRITGDIQGEFVRDFGWVAGIGFFHYDTGAVKVKKYRDSESLYKLYEQTGLIRPDEKNGGSHIELRAGLVYDTRDTEADPQRGLNIYGLLYGSPDIINGNSRHYLRYSFSFSHFVPMIKNRLTFAYRVSAQGKVAGDAPFYILQNYSTLYPRRINLDILGGEASLRGVNYNRIMGDGVAWANMELRLRLFSFRLVKQHWYIAVNPFFDMGMTTQKFRFDRMKAIYEDTGIDIDVRDKIYSGHHESLHTSIGIGGKLVMNDNFVLSAEYGIPFDKRDGKGGIYLNVNYIF